MRNRHCTFYFSVYGTTKNTAEEIARQTGADITEIIPEIPYDRDRKNYNKLAAFAKKETDSNARPAIKNKIELDGYDRVFVGYPMWWYNAPMIIYTLFDEYDFFGKTIIPFNTHMGSRDGRTYKTLKELEPKANVLSGLPVEMKDAEKPPVEIVKRWLAINNY